VGEVAVRQRRQGQRHQLVVAGSGRGGNPLTRLVYGDGPDSPRTSPAEALAAAKVEGDADIVLGWTVERHPWIDEPSFRARTVLPGYALAPAVNEGRITAIPIRLSAVGRWVANDPPEVAIVSGIRRGRTLAFGCSVGWSDVLARVAGKVVVEIDDHAPDLGAPEIPGNIVAVVGRPPATAASPSASRAADEVDLAIGATVAGLMPDRPTVQFGPGGIGEGIARAIDRPVRIWSGLVTDPMADLAERGLLIEPAMATYAWGRDGVQRMAAQGMLRLRPVSVTHDLTAMSATPGFVGCNTALQVGLDGSVNVERVGRRMIAAIGGHPDFCVAASRSVGGLSVIAVRAVSGATRGRSGHSTIVPTVDAVSTGRSDVDVVVTEHGVADLRGLGDAERAERLIGIAAPEHRDALRAARPP
jgi:acyl-CoA hydrolase